MPLKRLISVLPHLINYWRRIPPQSGLLLPAGSRLFEIFLLGIFAFFVVFLTTLLWNQSRSLEKFQFQRGALERAELRLQSEISKRPLARHITSRLPQHVDTDAVLTRVQRLAAENDVALINLAPSKDVDRASTAGLVQHIWDLQLTGNYPDVKDFLAQLLDQSPELWLAHLQLKAGGTDVYAKASLQAWSISNPTEPAHHVVAP